MRNPIRSLIVGVLLTATGCAQIAANKVQYQAKLEQFHQTGPPMQLGKRMHREVGGRATMGDEERGIQGSSHN